MVTATTTREMRGMAIASTIGRRNNPDVCIQRLNKLTYRVKSESNHGKWYTVINTYKEGREQQQQQQQQQITTCYIPIALTSLLDV
jgi:hypothetical protein